MEWLIDAMGSISSDSTKLEYCQLWKRALDSRKSWRRTPNTTRSTDFSNRGIVDISGRFYNETC